jgi:hypothetical protein
MNCLGISKKLSVFVWPCKDLRAGEKAAASVLKISRSCNCDTTYRLARSLDKLCGGKESVDQGGLPAVGSSGDDDLFWIEDGERCEPSDLS